MPAVASLITNPGAVDATPVRRDARATRNVLDNARPLSLLLGAARSSGEISEHGRIVQYPVKPVPPYIGDIRPVLLGDAVAEGHRLSIEVH